MRSNGIDDMLYFQEAIIRRIINHDIFRIERSGIEVTSRLEVVNRLAVHRDTGQVHTRALLRSNRQIVALGYRTIFALNGQNRLIAVEGS